MENQTYGGILMKKNAYSLVIVFLFLAGLSALCFAAPMNQLAGDYMLAVVFMDGHTPTSCYKPHNSLTW